MKATRLLHVKGAGEPSVVLLENEKYLLVASMPSKLMGGLQIRIVDTNNIIYNYKWEYDWPMSINLMNAVQKLDWIKHRRKLAGVVKKFRRLTEGTEITSDGPVPWEEES
jgi:hypothetical protein